MTALRCDKVNPPLLGMAQVVSEHAVRRALDKIDERAGLAWLLGHLDYVTRPLLSEPWKSERPGSSASNRWRSICLDYRKRASAWSCRSRPDGSSGQ